MLRRLFRALWGPPPTPPPRIRAVLEQLDELEGVVAGLKKRIKAVEGQISGGKRANAGEPAHEDAPGPTIEDQPTLQYPPRRPVSSTEHLARRFRTGG